MVSAGTSRRRFLGGAAAILADAATAQLRAAPAVVRQRSLPLATARGPRLAIVGGGIAGLTIAKYARLAEPRFDVVLLDAVARYVPGIGANWAFALGDMALLAARSYEAAARAAGYAFVQARCLGLDAPARRLVTDRGDLAYDYLVIAPGIDYDWGRIGASDSATADQLQRRYPGGFRSADETVHLRRKLREFRGGLFVQTVPPGNFRCAAAPYERVCLIAASFRRRRLKAKVLLLDHGPDIASMPTGFAAAFAELYPDLIEYRPSFEIRRVDPDARRIESEFETISFDDASIYPPVRAARLLETLGLADLASIDKAAAIDWRRYHAIGDERVYVAGDARPHGYARGAATAYSEGRYLAECLAAHWRGEEIPWRSPRSECYALVNPEPAEAIHFRTEYALDASGRGIAALSATERAEKRSAELAQAAFRSTRDLLEDLAPQANGRDRRPALNSPAPP